MNELARSLLFAGVMYDEDNWYDKINERFHISKTRQLSTNANFWAVMRIDDTIYIPLRGTDGTTLKKWLAAWRRNFRLQPTSDGFECGFMSSAKTIYGMSQSTIETFLPECKRIKIDGHSAAGGIGPILGYMLAVKYNIPVIVNSFAAAPSGDQRVQEHYINAHVNHDLRCDYWINPGDPMTFMFRDHKSLATSGEDMGVGHRLPVSGSGQNIIKWIPIIRAFEHSPREYCKSLMKFIPSAIHDLQWIYKQLVN